MDSNMILYLPFDDPDGLKAYDFSQYRNDGVLSDGASFSKESRQGKSITFNGAGECLTARTLPLSGNFTLCFFVRPASSRIGYLINFSGINNFIEKWIDITPGEWAFMAFVKNGSNLSAYLNSDCIGVHYLSTTPVGFSVNDYNLFGTEALLDEVKLYNVAKTAKELVDLQKESDVEYHIDGVNFKNFGVYVSASSGMIGRLERKENLSADWDNYHGIVRDKRHRKFKERTINLTCFIEAKSRAQFVDRVNAFLDMFDKAGNHRLKVEYDGKAKPLVYEVELMNEVDPSKKWGKYSNALMVSTFSLKLTEDEPVKKVLRYIGAATNSKVTITVTTSKKLNIYWGDGSHTYNVSGTDEVVEHTYEQPGEYDIVVAGVIEEIDSFTTDAIVVWEILK